MDQLTARADHHRGDSSLLLLLRAGSERRTVVVCRVSPLWLTLASHQLHANTRGPALSVLPGAAISVYRREWPAESAYMQQGRPRPVGVLPTSDGTGHRGPSVGGGPERDGVTCHSVTGSRPLASGG